MKTRILTTLLALFIVVIAIEAKNPRRVDRSTRKMPTWVNTLQEDYLIVSAKESDLESAKQKALNLLKQQIAEAVATNITTSTSISSSELMGNKTEAEFIEEFENMVQSSADKMPYLQSISLSKVDDYYWEEYYDRKTKTTTFDYHIKYPFTVFDLQRLVDEYDAVQDIINRTIKEKAKELYTFTQIDDIAKNMSTLRALKSNIAESDPRIAQIDELVNSYRNQYKNITMVEVGQKGKKYMLRPTINGRTLTLSQRPQCRSNCADRINVELQDGLVVITYDDYICLQGEDNWIDVIFKFGVNFVKTHIHIFK